MPARLSTLVNCHPSTKAAKGPEAEKDRLIEVEIMADRELVAAMAVVKVRVMAPARAVAQAAAVVKVRVMVPETTAAGQLLH